MMPDPTTNLLGREWQTYTVFILLAIFASVGWLVLRVPREERGALFDCILGGVVGAVLAGRALHVAFWQAYFAQNRAQIWQVSDGSIEWHGALLGAIIGVGIVSRWRQVDLRWMARQAAWVIPLLGVAGWWGCAAGRCAYGDPVQLMSDYPLWMTWDAPDIYNVWEPRFAVQRLGASAAVGILALMLLLIWREWLPQRRAGLALLLISGVGFMLGFLRGDYAPVILGLRADQWLDGLTFLMGCGWLILAGQADGHGHTMPTLHSKLLAKMPDDYSSSKSSSSSPNNSSSNNSG